MMKIFFAFSFIIASMATTIAQDTTKSLASETPVENIVTSREAASDKIENGNGINWKDYLGLGALVAAVAGLIGYLFKKAIDANIEIQKIASTKRLDEIEKSIVKSINEKKDIIDRTFEKTDLEERLLQTKIIYLWGEAENQIVKRVLKNANFNIENLITSPETSKKGYDIFFINNEKGSLNDDEMLAKVNELPNNILAFYYNASRKFFPTEKLVKGKEDKVNFATNASQIYGNLVNTLKYQDKIAKQTTTHA